MPNQDGTGPNGKGPMTGRKLGKCNTTSDDKKEANNSPEMGCCGKGRGTGTGQSREMGRGNSRNRERNSR